MATYEEHYGTLLAPVYSWMAGGATHAFALGAADLEGFLPAGSLAVDLGCGFGMHTVPLARAGWTVIGIDSSTTLINELREQIGGLSVRPVESNLLGFASHLQGDQRPELILCMGDTLTHLPDLQSVSRLAREVAAALAPQGRFIATFRDYKRLPEGPSRFIPVRSDDNRILTCFLEDRGSVVEVHDVLYTRSGSRWDLTVSSYPKLRLRPGDVEKCFADAGLQAEITAGPRGMVRLVADASSPQ